MQTILCDDVNGLRKKQNYIQQGMRGYATAAFILDCSLNSVGVCPVNFLNTVLNVVFELKPASNPIDRIVKFAFLGSTNNFFDSCTRYWLMSS